jgi:hypothetical protein
MRINSNILPKSASLLLPVILGFATVLAAQSPRSQNTEIEFRITRFDPSDGPPPTFTVRHGDLRVDVDVPLFHIAGPMRATLRDGRHLDFFQGNAPSPSVSVEIPEAWRRDLLLIFMPMPDNGGFRILPLHVPVSAIKGGDRFILNVSDKPLAIRYGGAPPLLIPSGRSGLISAPGDQGISSIPVVILEQTGDGWTTISTEDWPHDSRVREFLFFYRSPRTNHVTVHGVSERLDL